MATAETVSKYRKTALPTRYRHCELQPEPNVADSTADEATTTAASSKPKRAKPRRNGKCANLTVAAKATERPGAPPMATKKFPCKTCGRSFDSRVKRTRHQFTHLGGASEPRPLQCSVCQQTFSSRLALAEHQARHENKMLYNCPTCGRQFRQNTGLWRHLRTHDPTAARPRHPCTVCCREFSRPDYLRAHSATHTDPQKRHFVCELCGRGFLQSSDLNRHRLVHSTERRFQCTVCKRTFSDRSSRNRHEREHDPARRYVCITCGTTFKRTSKLRCHVARMHGNAEACVSEAAESKGRAAAVNSTVIGPSVDSIASKLSVCMDGIRTSAVCISSHEPDPPHSIRGCLTNEHIVSSAILVLGKQQDPVCTSSSRTVPLERADNRIPKVHMLSAPQEQRHELGICSLSPPIEAADNVSNSIVASGEPASEISVPDNSPVLCRSTSELPRSDHLAVFNELTNGLQVSDRIADPLQGPNGCPLPERRSDRLARRDDLRMSGESTNQLSTSNDMTSDSSDLRHLPVLEGKSDKLPENNPLLSSNELGEPSVSANGILPADTLTPAEALFGKPPGSDGLLTADKAPEGLEAIPGEVADDICRSLDDATVQVSLQDGYCGEADFVSFPDFGSQAYYDWLASFTSICNLLSLPLDGQVFAKVTQVLKTVSDALALPSGVLARRENFAILLGIWGDLQRLVGKHLSFVMEHLQA